MITVVYAVNSVILGGGNKVLLDIVFNLNKTKFTPYFICPGLGPLTEELTNLNIDFINVQPEILLNQNNKLGLLNLNLNNIPLFLKKKPVIFHANCFITYHALSFTAWISNTARICHLHYPVKDIDTIKWAFRIKPNVIIPCNQYLSKQVEPLFKKVIPNLNITPISNAVDVGRYNLTDFDSDNFKKELGISKDKTVITIIGHVSEVKGHKYFLEMIAGIKGQYPNILGLIVGEDKSPNKAYQKNMDSYVRKLGIKDHVRFLGFRKDIPKILAITDIIAQPSLEEGLPLTVLEAMAAGKPVITTPVGGVPEVIKDNDTGLLVPVRDSKGLMEKVKFLLDNHKDMIELGRRAKRFIVKSYSLDSYIKQIESVYHSLISN